VSEDRLKPRRLLPQEEALAEANRCLQCENAPCVCACPAKVDVPGFIYRLRTGNLKAAGRLLRQANIFGDTCGLVCPVAELCEGACTAGKLGHPIMIGCLQHYVAHHTRDDTFPVPKARTDAPRVAVVGAGPAGLTAARELGLRGLRVEVFEAEAEIGGLLLAGIPQYRLPTEVGRRESRQAATGLTAHTKQALGRDVTLADLRAEFAAVILAPGLGGQAELDIPGGQLTGVESALDFIERVRRGEMTRVPDEVVVIGGGNVATDAAATAKLLGARDVYLLYRRSFQEMPAWPMERTTAIDAGVHILVLAVPLEFIGDESDHVAAVKCAHTTLGERDAGGRRRPELQEGSLYTIRCELALLALGQRIPENMAEVLPGVESDEWGRLKLTEEGETSIEGVFACGDFANGGRTVVQAVGEGKAAANAVMRRLNWQT